MVCIVPHWWRKSIPSLRADCIIQQSHMLSFRHGTFMWVNYVCAKPKFLPLRHASWYFWHGYVLNVQPWVPCHVYNGTPEVCVICLFLEPVVLLQTPTYAPSSYCKRAATGIERRFGHLGSSPAAIRVTASQSAFKSNVDATLRDHTSSPEWSVTSIPATLCCGAILQPACPSSRYQRHLGIVNGHCFLACHILCLFVALASVRYIDRCARHCN